MAHQLALRDHPFLLLCKRDKEGVAEAGGLLKPGQVAEAVCQGRGYSLNVFKNPKVGSKPPRVVPFLTNGTYPSQFTKHKNGYELPPGICLLLKSCEKIYHRASTKTPLNMRA